MIAVAGWIAALALAAWALRLRSVLASRMELVARACHELRRPLTVATLGLELCERDKDRRGGVLGAVDLELASAGVALEDLSAAVAGLPGPWRIGAVDVSTLLAESFEAFRPLALAQGVDLGLTWDGEPVLVSADRLRLAQATGNLIANAIEHGEGRVELRGKADGDRFEIEVADNGHGLARRLETITRPRHGRAPRGRGLAIAADVAECHGGRLVASTADGESRVSLSVPLHRD